MMVAIGNARMVCLVVSASQQYQGGGESLYKVVANFLN